MTLADLSKGQKGKIVSLELTGLERRRLMDLGFTPGAVVEMVMKAAFGDPIAFYIRQTQIALRKNQARQIKIEPVDEAELAGTQEMSGNENKP